MNRLVKRPLPHGIDGFSFLWRGSRITILADGLPPPRAKVVSALLGLQGGAFGVVLREQARRSRGQLRGDDVRRRGLL